jgi:hypothetical protein
VVARNVSSTNKIIKMWSCLVHVCSVVSTVEALHAFHSMLWQDKTKNTKGMENLVPCLYLIFYHANGMFMEAYIEELNQICEFIKY